MTSGPVNKTAVLDNVPIDTFRNVNGFRFANFTPIATPEQFEHVFGLANIHLVKVFNTCPPGTARRRSMC